MRVPSRKHSSSVLACGEILSPWHLGTGARRDVAGRRRDMKLRCLSVHPLSKYQVEIHCVRAHLAGRCTDAVRVAASPYPTGAQRSHRYSCRQLTIPMQTFAVVERRTALQRLPSLGAARQAHSKCHEAVVGWGAPRWAEWRLCGVLRSSGFRNTAWAS